MVNITIRLKKTNTKCLKQKVLKELSLNLD